MVIKTIIFDFGGVLVGKSSESHGLYGLSSKFSKVLKIPVRKVFDVYHAYWDDWKTGKITIDYVYTNFLKDINSSYSKDKLINITLKYASLNKSSYNLVKKLKKNYKVVCLTNHGREWFESEVKRFNLGNLFNHIYSSYEIKLAKPDPKIYKYVLKNLKNKPEECIFIDDLRRNTEAAAKLGIHSINFKSVSQLKRELLKLGVKGL